MHRHTFRSEQGLSLVSVLVALALMGIVAALLSEMMSMQMGAAHAVEIEDEFSSMRKSLSARISCSETEKQWAALGINPATCPDTAPVFDKNGNLLISATPSAPTRIGKWTLRALCRGPGSGSPANQAGLEIQAARVRSGVANPLHSTNASDFFPDPMRKGYMLDWWSKNTRQKKGYAVASSLFMMEARPCSQLFGPKGGDPPQPVDCKVVSANFTRTNSTQNAAKWRTFTLSCPASHPFAMSASIGPACNSAAWQSSTAMGGKYPRTMVCHNLFYRDIWAVGSAERAAADASCAALGHSPDVATCSGVCCQFNN